MVTIVYRDWAAIEDHSEAEIAARLFPDQERYTAEERRRFELLEAHWDVPLDDHQLSEGLDPICLTIPLMPCRGPVRHRCRPTASSSASPMARDASALIRYLTPPTTTASRDCRGRRWSQQVPGRSGI